MKCHSLSHGMTHLICKTMVFFFLCFISIPLFQYQQAVFLAKVTLSVSWVSYQINFQEQILFLWGGYPETPSGALAVQELWQAPNCVIVLPLSPWCADETQASLHTASAVTSEMIQFSQHTAVSLDTCCHPNCCRKARLSTLERPPSLSIFMTSSHPHSDTIIAEWSKAGW